MIANKLALVQVMAWCWIGDKPLPEQNVVQLTSTYMHYSELRLNILSHRGLKWKDK